MIYASIQKKIFNTQNSTLQFLQSRLFLYLVLKILFIQIRKLDQEGRLVDYTCRMIDVVEASPITRAGNYIAGQLIRFCHSPSKDFFHKIGIMLKELKECSTTLKL